MTFDIDTGALTGFIESAKPFSHWPESYFRIRCLEYQLADDMFGSLFSRGGNRMLDVGCGVGLACVWAARYFAQVDGCDLDCLDDAFLSDRPSVRVGQELIAKAGISNVSLHAGDTVQYLLSHPETYDLIFSHFVMEHISDLSQMCEAIYNATVPGGWGLHIVPNTHDTIIQLLMQNLNSVEDNRKTSVHALRAPSADGRYLRELSNGWFVPVTHSEFISDYREQFSVNASEHYLFPLMESGFKVRDIRPMREHAYAILTEKA